MNVIIEGFIDPVYRYDFLQGPDKVTGILDARRNGVNCVALAHLAMADLFDPQPPLASELMCFELLMDIERFEVVENIEEIIEGDLVWFGRANPRFGLNEFVPNLASGQMLNWADCPLNHVAISTGACDESGDPFLLHASPTDGTNAIWPLSRFLEHERYKEIYGIKRFVK